MSAKQGSSPKLKHANGVRKASVAKAGSRSGKPTTHKKIDPAIREGLKYVGDTQRRRQQAYRAKCHEQSLVRASAGRRLIADMAEGHASIKELHGLARKIARKALKVYSELEPGNGHLDLVETRLVKGLSPEECLRTAVIALAMKRVRVAVEETFALYHASFSEEMEVASVA